jgi:hypothetical protein
MHLQIIDTVAPSEVLFVYLLSVSTSQEGDKGTSSGWNDSFLLVLLRFLRMFAKNVRVLCRPSHCQFSSTGILREERTNCNSSLSRTCSDECNVFFLCQKYQMFAKLNNLESTFSSIEKCHEFSTLIVNVLAGFYAAKCLD